MKQIKMNMQWACDGHMMEVVELVPHVKCRITETWIAEDCGKACKETRDYEIGTDENGNEFAHIGDYMLHSGAAINMQEDETTTNKEEKTMTNTNNTHPALTGTLKFEVAGATYESTPNGRFYCTPLNGKKARIGKLVFDAAFHQYIKETAINPNDPDEGAKIQAQIEDENPELGYDEPVQPEVKPEPKKKADKKPRTKKVQEGGFEYDDNGTKITLTAKQADFFKHLPDTDFWENGVDSIIWVDSLCDEIGGQFASKPMTVGAMISTICEKGLGTRMAERREGRKCMSFELTDLGKKIATALGL